MSGGFEVSESERGIGDLESELGGVECSVRCEVVRDRRRA